MSTPEAIPARPRSSSQTWRTFVRNHARERLACDFFVVVTATFRVVYVFLVVDIGTRRILHWNVTEHPTAEWTVQQFRSVLTGEEPYRFIVHDRDAAFSPAVDATLQSMNLRVLKTPVRVPQAAHAQAIIYTRHDPVSKLDLWHVPLAGGAARPLLNGAFNEEQARISPDGRWLAYVADGTGSQEIYVRRYPELDAPRQVSNGGGGQPQWRADQRELFYLSLDRSLMAASVIDARDASFGAPRRLFRTSIAEGPAAARDSYAAMPDGRSFLIDARRDSSTEPIIVMLDWAAGLTPMLPSPPAARETTEVARGRTR